MTPKFSLVLQQGASGERPLPPTKTEVGPATISVRFSCADYPNRASTTKTDKLSLQTTLCQSDLSVCTDTAALSRQSQ